MEPYEDVFVRKDGSFLPVAAAASPILRDGVPVGTVVEVRDLTSERAARAELDRQYEVSRVIGENAVSALILLDADGHATYVNQAWIAMTGFALEELAGVTAHDAIHHTRTDGTPYPMAECPIGRALALQRRVEPYEDVFIRKDGSFFPVRAAASPIVDGGRLMGTVLEIADITDERRMSAEREFQRSLLEAQGEASVDGLVVISPDQRIAWHNHRFREMWDLSIDIVARGDAAVRRHTVNLVEDQPAFLDRVDLVQRRRTAAHDEIRLLDGTVIERYGTPLEGPDGEDFGCFWSFRDITERKRGEERLAELYERERALSQRLQAGLLTSAAPAVDGYVLTSAYRPGTLALHVGGDWFDAFALPGGDVALVVGDVVGHDVDAAAAMGQLRGALRSLARSNGPSGVLEGMDALLQDVATTRMTTLVYVELDPRSGKLRYSCAGHPPPMVVGADGRTRLLWEARSTPLGCAWGAGYTQSEDVLAPGETLVLYSDGLIERRGEALDTGLSRLAQSASTRAGESPHLADHLCDELLPGNAHEDDVCVLALHRSDPSRFDLVLAAERGALAVLRGRLNRWLADAGLDPGTRADVVLAANEAVGNAIEHGHGHDGRGRVAVQAHLGDAALTMTVTDDGTWRPPSQPTHRGRGLAMISALMHEVDVHGDEHGTTVEMTRLLNG